MFGTFMSALLKSVAWTTVLIAGGWGIMTLTTPTPEQLLKARRPSDCAGFYFEFSTKLLKKIISVILYRPWSLN